MAQNIQHDYSDEAELNRLQTLAKEAFGVELEKAVRSGAEGNVLGIRGEHLLISKRLDCRTYFIHDSRWGIQREKGFFAGSDAEHFHMCRQILGKLAIPHSEIIREVVLKEQNQAAHFDPATKTVEKEPAQVGKRIARLSRGIEKIPVWSSEMILSLTSDRHIGFMQLHWPELSSETIHESHYLAYRVRGGWEPPRLPGAHVETVEAGILHSPAIGLLIDIYPAIRVIYKPNDARFGQKPVYYYDRHGKPTPTPRIAIIQEEDHKERPPQKPQN